jgi:trk system potassium uptake protein TrkH
MNWKTIARLSGILLIIIGFAMSTSLVWAFIDFDTQVITAFLVSVGITLVVGFGLFLFGRSKIETIFIREAVFIVASGWVLAGIFGSLPFYYTNTLENVIDCFFETVSGFTTTGSTVITNVEIVHRAVLYWRSLIQWLGGMGIIVLFIAVLPRLGVGAKKLFESEVPGPISSSFRPKLKHTSSILWKLYFGITVTEMIALMVCGMSFFDSICHSFCTMATGGYSTKNASIGHYDSTAIDIVVTIFMFSAGINFYLYYMAAKGEIKAAVKDYEFRVYTGLMLVCIIIIAVDIMVIHPDFGTALRKAAFQTLAVGTTTGFGTDNFNLYPSFSKVLMVVLMVIGGSAGSTAGGMKVSRLIVVVKSIKDELIRASRPHVVRAMKIGGHTIPREISRGILVFFAMFLMVLVVGTLFMTLLGLDMITALTAVVATLANIGPGLERVGSIENYAFIHPVGKLFLSFCMILGRLELVTVGAVLLPSFWKR